MNLEKAKRLMDAGDFSGANAICEMLISHNPDDANAIYLSALALGKLDRDEEAYKRLCQQREVFRKYKVRPRAHLDLGISFWQLGHLEDADLAIAQAAKMRPDSPHVFLCHGRLLKEMGQEDRAAVAAKHALSLKPDTPDVLSDLGVLLHQTGYFTEAMEAYERCADLAPNWEHIYSNWAAALMELGRPHDASALVERWLSVLPDSIEGLALKSVVSVETGDMKTAGELLDFDRFVKTVKIDVPDGYRDLAAFNDALEAYVLAHPGLKTPDIDHPTYHHPKLRITDEILGDGDGPVAELERAMHKATKAYFADLNGADGHPYVVCKPEKYRLSAWAAVLDGEGNQQQHIHEDGYMGGCYYIRIPEEISAPENGGNGTIDGGFEVGRPPDALHCKKEPLVRAIKPEEGLMVLFPAYMYHRTIPFESSERRICIAFDVVAEG